MNLLLIDDLAEAAAHLSDIGKAVVAPSVGMIRDALFQSSAAQRCPIVQHRAFSAWANARLAFTEACICLDPLLASQLASSRAIPVRASRAVTPTGLILRGDIAMQLPSSFEGSQVMIVDDVASSGATLSAVTKAVRDAGGCVVGLMLCAATDIARSALSDCVAGAWFTYIQRGVQALHARDACPFLPFAGKQIYSQAQTRAHPLPVEVCFPVTAFQRSAWAAIGMQRNLHRAVMTARRATIDRFDQALGRPATVADVPLLGPHIRLPLNDGHFPDCDTPLRELS